MSVLERQKIDTGVKSVKSYLIVYDKDKRMEAYRKASELRKEGLRVIMMNADAFGIEDTENYAKSNKLEMIRI